MLQLNASKLIYFNSHRDWERRESMILDYCFLTEILNFWSIWWSIILSLIVRIPIYLLNKRIVCRSSKMINIAMSGREWSEKKWHSRKLRKYSYIRITDREHCILTNCTRGEGRVCTKCNYHVDCRLGNIRRACMHVSTERNTKKYKNIGFDNQRNFIIK